MKICIISNLYQPYSRGGAEKIAESIATYLAKDNEVIVISTQPKGSACEQKENLKIYRFGPRNIFYYLDDYKHNVIIRLLWHFFDLFNFFSAREVQKILIKEKPNLVMIHNLKGMGYLIFKVINKLKIKNIQVLHDVQYAVPSGLIIKGQEKSFVANGFLTKIYQMICRKLIGPEIVVAPSRWLMDFYEEKNYFKNSTKLVLPNPVALSAVEQVDQVKKNNLLFLGQIEKHKGIEFLLEAIKDLDAINLIVAGQGSQLERLMKKYQDCQQVKFLGKVDQDKLDMVFRQISYLIVPTLCYENSPTVIYESYSHGRPVIVADIGGTAELIEENKTGYIFEAGNEKQMIEKIDLAINNKNYFELSAYCLEKIKNYSINNYIKKLMRLFE